MQACSNFLKYDVFPFLTGKFNCHGANDGLTMLLKPLTVQHAQVFAKSCEISTNITAPHTTSGGTANIDNRGKKE